MSERVESRRAAYAEMLRELAQLRSPSLVRAFASVPREAFLGRGPWRILRPDQILAGYSTTPDDDPSHLYQNVLVAIDETRLVNNGEPAGLARWLGQLDLQAGERFVHIGCGTGYYTAVAAEVVGSGGSVLAVEADPGLAERARANLEPWPQDEVVGADGSIFDAGAADAIFVNAGATHPQPRWLDALRPSGRLLVPLTFSSANIGAGVGIGFMLKVVHAGTGYAASFVSPVGIYNCIGARRDDLGERLRQAFQSGEHEGGRSLRRDPHPLDRDCWLHDPDFCLSRAALS